MRIAVIDDEKYSRVALVRQIEGFLPHAEIFEAGSGAQAVELLEKHTFDILFLDIHLGDMEGTTIAALARRLMPQAKIIFATAYSDYAVRAFELRADDYLLKPFQDKELVAAIERIHRKEQEKSGLSVSDELPLAKGDKSRYVLEAMEYISEHYTESSINITEIAQHLGVSEGHLSHVFKKETKYTVVGYLTQYRIHMAMKLLRDSRCKVYEVAGMVGYKDVAYFGSTFKKLTGLAPSEYQDRCR